MGFFIGCAINVHLLVYYALTLSICLLHVLCVYFVVGNLYLLQLVVCFVIFPCWLQCIAADGCLYLFVLLCLVQANSFILFIYDAIYSWEFHSALSFCLGFKKLLVSTSDKEVLGFSWQISVLLQFLCPGAQYGIVLFYFSLLHVAIKISCQMRGSLKFSMWYNNCIYFTVYYWPWRYKYTFKRYNHPFIVYGNPDLIQIVFQWSISYAFKLDNSKE